MLPLVPSMRIPPPLVVATTARLVAGLEVPIPTLPACVMVKSVRVEEPTTKLGTPAPKLAVSTESLANGVDEPTPTLPLIAKVVEAMTEVDEAKMPVRAQIGVEVAEVLTPKFEVGVKSNAPAGVA